MKLKKQTPSPRTVIFLQDNTSYAMGQLPWTVQRGLSPLLHGIDVAYTHLTLPPNIVVRMSHLHVQ